MAFISHVELRRNQFYTNVSAKNRLQDIILNQIKLKVVGTYKKDEQTATTVENPHIEDVVNKAHLDTEIAKIDGHISYRKEEYNEFKLLSSEQS